MKKLLFIIVGFMLLGSGCRKHKDDLQAELAKLPAETQTGANSFGCLVNGKAFLPKGSVFSGPILTSYYQHIYFSSPNGYVFQIAARDKSEGDNLFSVVLLVDSLQIASPQTIILKTNSKGGGSGSYYSSIFNGTTYLVNNFFTDSTRMGLLTIKKFDQGNQIVSGTFWFTATNAAGDSVKITDGRFDMHYTQ